MTIPLQCRYLLILIMFALPSVAVAGKVVFKIVDQSGNPVSHAEVGVNIESPKLFGFGAGVNITRSIGFTSKDGTYVANISAKKSFTFDARKNGYYISNGQHNGFWKGELKSRIPVIRIEIKEKINPIPLYAINWGAPLPGELPELPVLNEFVGYDLMVRDWVTPYGVGETGDLLFKVDSRRANAYNDYDVELTVRFSNKDDGIIFYDHTDVEIKSELRLAHSAPKDGYSREYSLSHQRTPGVLVYGVNTNPGVDVNYFFRVRSRHDGQGKMIGAHYGKIYGKIILANFIGIPDRKPTLLFNYYLNPESNDRNLEFDVGRNLFELDKRRMVQYP